MRKIVLLFLSVLAAGALFAQNRQVSGVVTDEGGTPVVGATVTVQGTNNTVVTGVNGNYTIAAPAGSTLVVAYLGMGNVTVAVDNRAVINVEMNTDAEMIDDVIVTGYGQIHRGSFTGVASVVSGAELAKKADANFIKSLEGNIPGVQMSLGSSMPGTSGSMYIRGRGSLNSGTAPLFVVDGMPVESDANQIYSTTNDWFDPMATINPTDIQNVVVLKDAAATAIYGSRAANGVVVITTKKGQSGKFNLNLDIKQGFVSIANNNMNYANAQETFDLFVRGTVAAGIYPDKTVGDQQLMNRFKSYGWDGKTSYDWHDAVQRDGYYQEYSLSASGRQGQTGYFASMGYLNTNGLIIGSDLERFSGRVNLDTKFKFMTFGVNSSYSFTTKNGFSQSLGGSMSSALTAATSSMLPMYPFYNEDGTYANVSSYNPLALYDKNLGELNRIQNQTINLSPYLQIDFGKGIYAKSTLGVNMVRETNYEYWSAVYNPQGMQSNGRGYRTLDNMSMISWSNVLGWNHISDNARHSINLLLGQEVLKNGFERDRYEKQNFPFASDGMRDPATASTTIDATFNKTKRNLASYFIDAHYALDNKYFLSASYRRDGSSVFGADRRWGNFWSVGAKWRAISEDFLADNGILTDAVLRASYGTVGNQDIGSYAARGLYGAGYNYHSLPGMVPESITNRDLTWEVSNKFDVGIDLSFINAIHVTVDYYNDITSSALFSVPLSFTSGLATTMRNVGKIRNSGVELSINADIMNTKDFNWTAYANATFNKNKVIKLNGEPMEYTWEIVEEGRPYRQYYVQEYAGVDRETGSPMWYKGTEGEETTTNYSEAGKRYMGSADPKVFGGFGTNFRWKNLDFGLTFNYRLGGSIYDSGAYFTGFGPTLMTPLKDVAKNSWTPENKNGKYPQWIYGDPEGATNDSSRWIYNSSYLRLSNITLGYTLPEHWTRKALIEKLRVYASVDNLYTFTAKEFVGYTPDTYASGSVAWQYPAMTTFIGGIQITF